MCLQLRRRSAGIVTETEEISTSMDGNDPEHSEFCDRNMWEEAWIWGREEVNHICLCAVGV